MKLSIIVPVYNMAAEDKLIHCLDSLVSQTILDTATENPEDKNGSNVDESSASFEIIAVDDCSTDNSLEILKEYEAKYPNIFHAVHSEKNLHQGGAKNIGIRMAKGEWIGFIDADDWITPDMYEKLIRKAEETGADCVGCDYSLVDHYTFEVGQIEANSEDNQTGVLGDDQKKSMILDSGSLVVKIYKRSMIIENELFFPENIFYEDNAMSNSYLLLNKHYEYIKEPMYYYYQHNTSTVHTITTVRCEDRMEAGRVMISEAKRHGFYEKYKEEIEYKFTLLFYINTLFSYMPGVKHTSLRFVKKMGREMKEYFPSFELNPYYIERTHPEEKKLIHMQQKNTLMFVLYYKLLWFYRKKIRKV